MRALRIKALEEMLDANPKDPFALYGLALEHKADGKFEEALSLLEHATALPNPEVYAFYQHGEVLMALGESEDAVEILELGIERARTQGHMKALRELQELRDTLD